MCKKNSGHVPVQRDHTFATVYSTTFLSVISLLLPTSLVGGVRHRIGLWMVWVSVQLVHALSSVTVDLLQPLLHVVERVYICNLST